MHCRMISQWKIQLHQAHQPHGTMQLTQSAVLNIFTLMLVSSSVPLSDCKVHPLLPEERHTQVYHSKKEEIAFQAKRSTTRS